MSATTPVTTAGTTPRPRPLLGYGTNGFADHPLADALDVLQANGYDAVALTLGHPHFDPFAEGWLDRAIALRADLERRGLRVVVETGARYVLDPVRKHRPNLLDDDADPELGRHPWDNLPPVVLDMTAAHDLGYEPAGDYAHTVRDAIDWLLTIDEAELDPEFFPQFFDYAAEDRHLAARA